MCKTNDAKGALLCVAFEVYTYTTCNDIKATFKMLSRQQCGINSNKETQKTPKPRHGSSFESTRRPRCAFDLQAECLEPPRRTPTQHRWCVKGAIRRQFKPALRFPPAASLRGSADNFPHLGRMSQSLLVSLPWPSKAGACAKWKMRTVVTPPHPHPPNAPSQGALR